MKETNYNRIIFFDGVCNFCDGFVEFVMKRDKHQKFRYSWLQSDFAERFMSERNISINMDTIILFEHGKLYYKSEAIFRIFRNISGSTRYLSLLRFFPKVFNEFFYDIFAKYRYKIFGQKDNCTLPSPEEKKLFLV